MDRRLLGMPPEPEGNSESAPDSGPESIDPATADRIRKALANPRPPSPAAEVFARLDARKAAYKAKRGIEVRFSEEGSPHDELAPGLRSVPFERRATIYYRVTPETVDIVHIAWGGRNAAMIFKS